MHLASYGEEIRVWRLSESASQPTVSLAYNPHNEPINSLAWDSKNKRLASAAQSGGSVIVRRFDTGRQSRMPVEEAETSLAFNRTSRYVLTGGKSGRLRLYDRKHLRLKRSYLKVNHETTGVLFMPDCEHLVSGHVSGDIVTYKLTSGIAATPLRIPGNGVGVRSVSASSLSPTMLASGHENGLVALWNIASQTSVSSLPLHKGSVSIVAFSPVNEMLLSSCGMDGRVCMIDTHLDRHVSSIQLESSATALDLSPDGYTLAVGTGDGTLLIYDLRDLQIPLFNMNNVHCQSVTGVKFENDVRDWDFILSNNSMSNSFTESFECGHPLNESPVVTSCRSPLGDMSDNVVVSPPASSIPLGSPQVVNKKNRFSMLSVISSLAGSPINLSSHHSEATFTLDSSPLSIEGLPSSTVPEGRIGTVCSEAYNRPVTRVTFRDAGGERDGPGDPTSSHQPEIQLPSAPSAPSTNTPSVPLFPVLDTEAIREIVRSEVTQLKREFLQAHNNLLAKMIKELWTTEQNIIRPVLQAMNEQKLLLEENERLRVQLERLRHAY